VVAAGSAALALCGLVPAGAAAAAAPAPLSADTSLPDLASSFGSGSFGTWTVDADGLPAYRYELDEQTAPQARQPEVAGSTAAWHQLGNEHIVANAFNHGYVQLWSQDRVYQWANFYEATSHHYAGGYGYLRADGRTISTLYLDRPAGATTQRDFGIGYAHRKTTVPGVAIDDHLYAPFGDDPALLHDVTIRNTSSKSLDGSWFEYWDVNPYDPAPAGVGYHRALGAPHYDGAQRTLSVDQLPDPHDARPLSIYAAALRGDVADFDTDTSAFFGAGTRGEPAAVRAGRLSGSVAAPVPYLRTGSTMFALRSPVHVAPGQSVTLRYAYGVAHAETIPGLVSRYRGAGDPLRASTDAWKRWVPRASLPGKWTWLARELAWDAYMVRSGATYEETCGHHILSQGGWYQYDSGAQLAFRDPLQQVLPMIYADPYLVREVLEYSAQEQTNQTGAVPYGIIEGCVRFDLGTSDDLDVWLLLAAAEYGLASRDLRFFDTPVAYSDAGSETLWDHLKLAYRHQEAQRGPHGGYLTGATGDWSDFATQYLGMTESILVSAQLAYVYPRLAELADARGDTAFARELRARSTELRARLRAEWTGRGWYSRGYSGARRLGTGAIFEEPQPWAILAGAPSRPQAGALVANIRRFLTGIGAPAAVKGPGRTGSSLSPASSDPGVTERSGNPGDGVGDNNAVYQGGEWFAVNGWLTWALGALDGVVPHARDYAFDELRRNALATRADVYPDHWNGTLSVDDVCWSFYSSEPSMCSNGGSTRYDGQVMHQPAWSLWDMIALAGVEPTADGYRIIPHLPFDTYSLRLPQVGVTVARDALRGYVTPQAGGTLAMRVAPPAGAGRAPLLAWAGGHRTPYRRLPDGTVEFTLSTDAGRPADWAVTVGGAKAR
jgi:hypothetical protein